MGAVLPIVALVAGTGLQAYGQIQQGKAAAEAAEYNARLTEHDAAVAEQSAEAERRAGKFEAAAARRKARIAQGERRAQVASSGITLTSPSALNVLSESAEAEESDIRAIIYNASVRAQQRMSEAGQLRGSASLQRFQGKQAKRASRIQAGTTLATGAARVATTARRR